jgi:hypothetical protein
MSEMKKPPGGGGIPPRKTPATVDELFGRGTSKKVPKKDPFVDTIELGEKKSYEPTRKPSDEPDIKGKSKGKGKVEGQKIDPAEARLAKNVLTKKISDAPAPVQEAWERARQKVLDATKGGARTKEAYIGEGGLFSKTRQQFWKEVVDDPAAAQWFVDNGYVFTERGRAPLQGEFFKFDEKYWDSFRVTLDHTKPKALGNFWRQSLNPEFLQFVTQSDNRMLQLLETVMPWLKRVKP